MEGTPREAHLLKRPPCSYSEDSSLTVVMQSSERPPGYVGLSGT